MLNRIYEYAKRKNLKAERGFEPQSFSVALAYADGQWSVVPLGSDERGKLVNKCPKKDRYDVKTGCHPFAESVATVLGKGEKNDSFIALLREATNVMPILNQVAQDLCNQSIVEKLTNELQENGIKEESWIAIEVDGRLLVETPELVAWWREYYNSKVEQKVFSNKAVCYASGETVEPICNYTPLKGFTSIGASATTPFLSCASEHPAFSSYGLTEGAIRSIGAEAWQYVLGGLWDLIERSLYLRQNKEHGIKMLYFYSKEVGKDLLKEMFNGGYEEEDESDVAFFETRGKDAVTTYATGKGKVEDLDATYCLCLLSGNQSRLRFLQWLEGDLSELSKNVKKWKEDTTILFNGKSKSYSYRQLIKSLGNDDDGKEWPQTDIINSIFTSIITGAPISSKVPNKIFHKLKKRFSKTSKQQEQVFLQHVALIQAYLIRKGAYMGKGLQKDHPSVAYQLGRLMAIIESIQLTAAGGKDGKRPVLCPATKCISKASVSPNSIFPRLLGSVLNHYLAKIKRDNYGLAVNLNKEIKKIMGSVETPYPSKFNSDDQMMFFIGYYNQSFNKKSAKDTGDEVAEEPSNEVVDAVVE